MKRFILAAGLAATLATGAGVTSASADGLSQPLTPIQWGPPPPPWGVPPPPPPPYGRPLPPPGFSCATRRIVCDLPRPRPLGTSCYCDTPYGPRPGEVIP